jgi:hypothetical protein
MMNPLTEKLTWLETRLRSLIEGGTAKLYGGKIRDSLEIQLAEAFHITENESTPDTFLFLVNPVHLDAAQNDFTLLEELKRAVVQFALERNIKLEAVPIVRISSDADLSLNEFRILAQNNIHRGIPQTSSVSVRLDTSKTDPPKNAYLIVDGTRVVPLDQTVLNIGRREDNMLVVNDPRVSRLHAQLRWMHGHYVIFDLDSSGGTWVNGKRIHQHTLQSGDVISLSGVPLVFGQEIDTIGETQEMER